ncbi:MAG: hypothetical protein LBW85_02350 [Deltaproteobacteria bacterium]|nr:hypothetical protein [Deltaproteobacteria bacterium]
MDKVWHFVKLGFLAAALAFFFWWGWAGNFIFTPGSLFRLTSSTDRYVFSAGGKDMGYARRAVAAGAPDQGFSITEESLVRLSLPGLPQGELRLRSESSYGPDGRLREAEFTVPGLSGALARAQAADGFLDFSLSLGTLSRKVTLKLPGDGPVLVSGVVPWLSRQREVPLGKVLYVRVFDPVNMGFETARLTVEDDTRASEEIRVFKVTLALPAGTTVEWLDANGRLLRQSVERFQAGLTRIPDNDAEAIAKAEDELSRAPALPEGSRETAELAARYFLDMSKDVFEEFK